MAAGSRIAAAARVRRSQPPWLECKGIRAAGSPLCATCAVYPPPCVSGILLPLLTLPSSFPIICPPTLFLVPFFSTTCTRPEPIERSPAPPRPAESSSSWRRVSPRSAWKSPLSIVPVAGRLPAASSAAPRPRSLPEKPANVAL